MANRWTSGTSTSARVLRTRTAKSSAHIASTIRSSTNCSIATASLTTSTCSTRKSVNGKTTTIIIARTGRCRVRLRSNDLSKKLELTCHRGLETLQATLAANRHSSRDNCPCRCWEDERGPARFSFGCMLAQSLSLPIRPLGEKTRLELQRTSRYGIPKLTIPDA